MRTIDLTEYGITGSKGIVYQPSYEKLFYDETDPGLTGYEKGTLVDNGAVNVMTSLVVGCSNVMERQ